jgi:glycosyltransferase involved in cell wall biosynthesis
MGVASRVCLPGWLGPADVDNLLRDADMLVLPSYAENLPMVIVEAFAHGVAVVATPVGAIPEVIEDGVTGLIAPVGDVDAFAAAIQKLANSPALRSSLGSAARESHSKRFEMTSYIDRLVEIWRQSALLRQPS